MRIMAVVVLSTMAAFGLAGCASIPLKTVYNLWSFDPWTSDFRQWRAAVRAPDGRGMSLDRARIEMKVETLAGAATSPQVETFILDRSPDPADLVSLAAERRAGYALAAYRIAPADHARLEALRARILAAKKDGTHKRGSLSISASSCGGPATPPEGAFLFSTYLMVDPKDGYNPMAIDYDLGPQIRKTAAAGAPSPICAVK
jgi:hypothetical protein